MTDSGLAFESGRPLPTEFRVNIPPDCGLVVSRRLGLLSFLPLGEAAKTCPPGKYLYYVRFHGNAQDKTVDNFCRQMEELARKETGRTDILGCRDWENTKDNRVKMAHALEHLIITESLKKGTVDKSIIKGGLVVARTTQSRDGTTVFWFRKGLMSDEEQLKSLGAAIEMMRTRI